VVDAPGWAPTACGWFRACSGPMGVGVPGRPGWAPGAPGRSDRTSVFAPRPVEGQYLSNISCFVMHEGTFRFGG
jgi:hypothetical protein